MTEVETVRREAYGTNTTKLLEEIRDLVTELIDLESPAVQDVRKAAVTGKLIAEKFMQMDQLILAGAGIPTPWEEAIFEEGN